MGRKTRYDVRPRYTAGSPGMVDEATAVRVAEEETEAYAVTLMGIYGERERARAERLGLTGIVQARVEKRNAWEVEDLMTGEKLVRPFPEKVTKILARHPERDELVEVEDLGEDPDEHYHARLVRSKWDHSTWSVPRHELTYETRKGRRS